MENTDRRIVKSKLKEIQAKTMEMFRQQKAGRKLFGERKEIWINGKVHRMMCYGIQNKNVPVYFDIHGGGFTWGTIEDGDLFCQELHDRLGFQVYSLDYPLVPDAEYPEPLMWVYETIDYMRRNSELYGFDADQILVGGRSAGGNLAAALSLLAKEKGDFQFLCQVLDHPWLDLCEIIPEEERYLGEGALGSDVMKGLALGYADEEQQKDIYCSPLNADVGQLKGLPPAVIQVCELDSLRVEGERYAEKLEFAGNQVKIRCVPGVLHGFTEEDSGNGEEGRRWLIEKIAERMKL
ncbi:MAG: alpha/beta hydrolase [Dorea sp.]